MGKKTQIIEYARMKLIYRGDGDWRRSIHAVYLGVGNKGITVVTCGSGKHILKPSIQAH